MNHEVISTRETDHGPRSIGLPAIAKIWSGMLSVHLGMSIEISPTMVPLMLAAFKLSRASFNHEHHDNYVDAINYIGFAEELSK